MNPCPVQQKIDEAFDRLMIHQRLVWERARRREGQLWRHLRESLIRDYLALEWALETGASK